MAAQVLSLAQGLSALEAGFRLRGQEMAASKRQGILDSAEISLKKSQSLKNAAEAQAAIGKAEAELIKARNDTSKIKSEIEMAEIDKKILGLREVQRLLTTIEPDSPAGQQLVAASLKFVRKIGKSTGVDALAKTKPFEFPGGIKRDAKGNLIAKPGTRAVTGPDGKITLEVIPKGDTEVPGTFDLSMQAAGATFNKSRATGKGVIKSTAKAVGREGANLVGGAFEAIGGAGRSVSEFLAGSDLDILLTKNQKDQIEKSDDPFTEQKKIVETPEFQKKKNALEAKRAKRQEGVFDLRRKTGF